jgi:hypothetical protein
MDIRGLLKVAKSIKSKFPGQAQEIIKIAQELDADQNTQPSTQTPVQNPNIDSFAKLPEEKQGVQIHKVTLTLEVPENYDKLRIMNQLLPLMENSSEVKLKSYAFVEN